ncbi:MAG: 50S ribosomal protein L11 methyltransferase [Pseudomonadota bacterium]|nr:50S ribosomal protein L11 methyltransferase [Pseudomonadota bacterium]
MAHPAASPVSGQLPATDPPGAPRLRELTVDAPADREASVVAAVYRLGVQGVEVRDAESGAPAGRVHVVAWLPPSPTASRAIRGLRRRLGPDARCEWRDIAVTWEAAPPAASIGARFVVVAPGVAAPPGRDAIVLDGHLAFGDGLHPTTVLCVEALERRAAAPGGPAPSSVLDVGTGTGILALVAARLGATRVVAQDIDPLSLWAARRHVEDNGASAVIDVVEVLPAGTFDLVVANLYFAPLLALIPAMAARVAPGGELVVSGFGVDARGRVEAVVVAAGLVVREAKEREGWGLLVCGWRVGAAE